MTERPNRAERRRRARADAKQRVVIAGTGVIASTFADAPHYEARRNPMPRKVPGQHRWIATAMWHITAEQAAGADDADRRHLLDHENLLDLAIGCVDCERTLGDIHVGEPCPAGDTWGDDR